MPTFPMNCPHCGKNDVATTFRSQYRVTTNDPHAREWRSLFSCNNCQEAVVIASTGTEPQTIPYNLLDHAGIRVTDIYPQREKANIPEHLPQAVERAYTEAYEILDKSPSMAVTSFRKALEIGLKDLSQDVDAWKLHRRIDEMERRGLITSSLKDWAHHVRLEGNAGVHDLDDYTKQEAIELGEFTRLVLTYLFTLPGQVAAARKDQNT